jgi:predicted homoserine dehydrogenase-like protein
MRIARVVLFATSWPAARGPVVEVCAVAKRDLQAGEVLDDYGMYMTYGEAVNATEMSDGRYCPRVSSRAAAAARRPEGPGLTYDDVDLPAGRVADRLRPSNTATSVRKRGWRTC